VQDALALDARPARLVALRDRLRALETEEEQVDTLSFAAYRWIATTIILPSLGSNTRMKQVVTIDPLDLATAQRQDAKRGEVLPLVEAENPARA
jgi:hypothetical protein